MLKVKINNATNFTAVELVKLKTAAAILEKVVNSVEFKDRILSRQPFANNEGLTNQQIYDLIQTGKEILSPEEDHEIDVDITMYWKWGSVIGYTYPNTLKTWINRRFYKQFDAVGIAGNIMHEYLHKMGFDHDFYNTAKRPNSVPYAVGYLVEELGYNQDNLHLYLKI